MRAEDFRINEQVRRVLARHWIDTSKLDYSTIDHVVYLRGMFGQVKTVKRVGEGIDAMEIIRLIVQIEREINRIPSVGGILWKLKNYKKDGGKWQVHTAVD